MGTRVRGFLGRGGKRLGRYDLVTKTAPITVRGRGGDVVARRKDGHRAAETFGECYVPFRQSVLSFVDAARTALHRM